MQFLSPDSKFSQFIYTLLDYVKLGLVFLLFSIPGITTGAAAAAVMTVGMRIERKEAPVIFRPFWQAFRENFRQGTLLTLVFMLILGVIAFDWYALTGMEVSTVSRLITAVLFLLALFVGGIALWAFPTLARFSLSNRQILHNSVIHFLACFPQTLLALVVATGGFVLATQFAEVLPIVTFFVPAFAVWYMSRTCVKRFRKFDGTAEAAQASEQDAVGPEAQEASESMLLN